MTNRIVQQENEIVEFPVALQSAPPPVVSIKARQYFQEGMAHLQCGEAAEAVAALSQSIEYAPAFPQAHVFLGIAHALTSNIYPAIDHLEEAAKLDPDSFAAHYTLAQLNFKLRTPEPGYEAARRAVHWPQRSSSLWYTCDEKFGDQLSNHDNALRSDEATTPHVGRCPACRF